MATGATRTTISIVAGAACGYYLEHLFQNNLPRFVAIVTLLGIFGFTMMCAYLRDIAVALEKRDTDETSDSITKTVTS